MLGIGMALCLVVGGDVGVGDLESRAHLGRNLLGCRLHLGGGNPEVVDVSSIEALGQLPQSNVAASSHVGEDRSNILDRRLDLRLRSGQHSSQVACNTTKIQTLEHDGEDRCGPGEARNRFGLAR